MESGLLSPDNFCSLKLLLRSYSTQIANPIFIQFQIANLKQRVYTFLRRFGSIRFMLCL